MDMKKAVGRNHYHMNTATMKAILNEHLRYSTDQVVTDVVAKTEDGAPVFIITMEDKPEEPKP
jgi:hypothetical protein